MLKWEKFESSQGFALFFVILLVLSVMLLIAGSIIFLTSIYARTSRGEVNSTQSYYMAEAGVEDALLRLMDEGKQFYSPYAISVGSDGSRASTTVTMTEQGDKRIIESRGNAEQNIKVVETTITEESTQANFHYGVQVGQGGISIENNSDIQGSVFSNGDVEGKGRVTGDVFAASTSSIEGSLTIQGNARGYSLDGPEVTGEARLVATTTNATIGNSATTSDLYSDVIADSEVWGDAYYHTSITNTTVHGAISTTSLPNKVVPKDFPISDSEIEGWKKTAGDAKVISSDSTECSEGNYEVPDGSRIGPVKIECDVTIKNQVIVEGYVWIEGNLWIQNQGVLELDESFEDKSSAVVVDNPADRLNEGVVSLENGGGVKGSGNSSSYLMIVSQNESAESGGDTTAINIQNSSESSVFYAPHGKISISNNVSLKEATGYRIILQNNSELVYESGLANLDFSSGPEGGWKVEDWKEIK